MDKNNRKIRVLLCSPNNKQAGGIAKWTGHILAFYNSLESTSFIKLDHFYSNGKIVYQNTPVFSRLFCGVKKYIAFLLNLRKKLKGESYDLVHFTSSGSLGLLRDYLSLQITKKYRVKSVIHFRFGRIPFLYEKMNWEQKLLHKVIILSDKVVVIDKKSYNSLKMNGYNNIVYLPNPLSENVLSIIDNNSTIEVEEKKIIFAGHVVKTKGVFELIDACRNIADIKLKIIGAVSSNMKRELIKYAGDECHGWLTLTGEMNYEDTIKEMMSANVFVLPSYTEGFPNVVLESMACGCAIVATSVGAIPEMLNVHNSNVCCGICIEPKNVLSLQEALLKMLRDRSFAVSCKKNAQDRVLKEYSMDIIWNKLVEFWRETILNKKNDTIQK